MISKVLLGTIGSGSIVKQFLSNLKNTDNISLRAVYSRCEEKGKELAKEFGASNVFTSLDEFLSSDMINTVYIASPNRLHFEQARKALLSGKNVYLEKPFCPTVAETKELIDLAKSKNLFLAEAIPTPYLPNYKLLKDAIKQIGNVRLVLSNYSQYSSRYDAFLRGENPNVFNPEYCGGCLMDINYYNVYLTISLFGMPKKCSYHANIAQNGIDTSGILTMQYNGFIASCAGAKDTQGVNYYQIEGEKGSVYVSNGSNGLSEIQIKTNETSESITLQVPNGRLMYEMQKLVELTVNDDKAFVNFLLQNTIKTVQVIEESRKAAGIHFPSDN